jgi:hypothetical protein
MPRMGLLARGRTSNYVWNTSAGVRSTRNCSRRSIGELATPARAGTGGGRADNCGRHACYGSAGSGADSFGGVVGLVGPEGRIDAGSGPGAPAAWRPGRPAPGLLRPTTLGLVCHPVGLATPYRAAARGQPSTQPPADIAQLCPRVGVW